MNKNDLISFLYELLSCFGFVRENLYVVFIKVLEKTQHRRRYIDALTIVDTSRLKVFVTNRNIL